MESGASCRASSEMGELELAQSPVEGWIINPYEHGFLDGPGNTMCLPIKSGKTVHIDTVSSRLTMFIYGGGGPKDLFKPLSKGPS